MKKLLFGLLACAALLTGGVSAQAQNVTFLSVASCGNQTYLAGRPAPPTVDLTGQNCISGTINASTTAVASASAPTYSPGANPLSMDLSGNLRVLASVSLTGSTSNASSGVATSSTNTPTVGYSYGFNGTTWDQLQVTAAKSLKQDVTSIAGTATATGSGAMSAGTQRIALATDSPGVITFGQTTMSASVPVTIASNQSGVPVTIATAPVLVAGSAIIGKVGVDQTTPGTTNAVALAQIGSTTTATGNGTAVGAGVQRVSLGDIGTGEYETVAASQTAQVLGATGATGDYLFQLVCAPATTSPGVVTVLDNASAVVSFAGGATSVSNLIPFVIPVNAYSVSGAWKVTTGANISCVGVGNFL